MVFQHKFISYVANFIPGGFKGKYIIKVFKTLVFFFCYLM